MIIITIMVDIMITNVIIIIIMIETFTIFSKSFLGKWS